MLWLLLRVFNKLCILLEICCFLIIQYRDPRYLFDCNGVAVDVLCFGFLRILLLLLLCVEGGADPLI